jgi:hypothetical protein
VACGINVAAFAVNSEGAESRGGDSVRLSGRKKQHRENVRDAITGGFRNAGSGIERARGAYSDSSYGYRHARDAEPRTETTESSGCRSGSGWLEIRDLTQSLGGGKQDYVALVVAASIGDGFAVTGVMEGPDLTGSEMG